MPFFLEGYKPPTTRRSHRSAIIPRRLRQFHALVPIPPRDPIRGFFGSQIRGTARDDSDIDVLIDFDLQATIGLFEFIEIQDQLSEALGRPVDLLTPQALSPYSCNQVLQEAEPVYEA